MMRRLPLLLVAAGVLVSGVWTATAFGSSTSGIGAFSDDDGSVHESDINGLAASGITKGCNPPANNHYCPTRAVTRQEMASFLVRALQLPSAEVGAFDDTAGSIHQPDIAALAQAGITKGCNPPANTRYCPTAPVTREQMASFLVRALQLPSAEVGAFDDTAGSVHRADIVALAEAGITKGCNPPANTRYCPSDSVTRQQMASFLVRALDDVEAILNRLSLRDGITCTKDGASCSGRVTLASGTDLEVMEGWYQVLPYRSGEKAAFTASSTRVTLTWNGSPLPTSALGVDESTSPATRLWRAKLPELSAGTHVLRGVWRWAGDVSQTVTYIISVD